MIPNNFLFFLIAQSIVIIGAVVTAFVIVKVAIAKNETRSEYIERMVSTGNKDTHTRLESLHQDHKVLASKVDGISRHVTSLETMHRMCPYVKSDKDMFSDT